MTLLDATGRARTVAHMMRELKTDWGAVTKPDLKAALDAADQWVEDNTSSFNLALPQPFRGQATPDQKAALLGYVLARRMGRLRTEEDG